MRLAILVIAMATIACESPTLIESSGPVIQTGLAEYAVAKTDSEYRTTIDVRYSNPLADTMYIGHCGGLSAILQKREGAGWANVWSMPTLDCAGPTVALAPGKTIELSIDFFACRLSNCFPRADDVTTGTYRLEFAEVLVHYNRESFVGELVPKTLRVSNTFSLQVDS